MLKPEADHEATDDVMPPDHRRKYNPPSHRHDDAPSRSASTGRPPKNVVHACVVIVGRMFDGGYEIRRFISIIITGPGYHLPPDHTHDQTFPFLRNDQKLDTPYVEYFAKR